MRTILRILVSPFWALALLAMLAFTLLAVMASRLWAITGGEVVVPVRAQVTTSVKGDTPLLMALLAQAINLGVGVAVYIGVLQQSSVASLEALITPVVTAFVSFLISAFHGHFAQKSYAVQAANGLLMGAGTPVGVGSGNPPPEPVEGPALGSGGPTAASTGEAVTGQAGPHPDSAHHVAPLAAPPTP